jgi:serralysin
VGGRDVLLGGPGNDGLWGDALAMAGHAPGNDDRLFGGTGADQLFGDAQSMTGDTVGGDDRLVGNGRLWDDVGAWRTVVGGFNLGGTMAGRARGGDDILIGGGLLSGDAMQMVDQARGDDTLIGATGSDQLFGDANPYLPGSDLARVTRGADRFVLSPGSGRDIVGDFEHGRDKIDLGTYWGIDGFADIRGHAAQVGMDTVIDLGAAAGGAAGRDVLTLAEVRLAGLDAGDFLFG